MVLDVVKALRSHGLLVEEVEIIRTDSDYEAEEREYEREQDTYLDPRCGCPDHHYLCSVHGPNKKE
jgi:hypothetical protein